MKTEIIKLKDRVKYKYISVLIADEQLTDYDLVKVWNKGVDCKKAGSTISILLRKPIKSLKK